MGRNRKIRAFANAAGPSASDGFEAGVEVNAFATMHMNIAE